MYGFMKPDIGDLRPSALCCGEKFVARSQRCRTGMIAHPQCLFSVAGVTEGHLRPSSAGLQINLILLTPPLPQPAEGVGP